MGPDSNESIVEAEFSIDTSSLLLQPFVDSNMGISMMVPKGWTTMDAEIETAFKANLLGSDYQNSQLKLGFINANDTSIMLLLDVTPMDRSIFSELRNNYNEVLNGNNSWENIHFQVFTYNCLRIEQYVFQDNKLLNFKLVCYNNKIAGSPTFELLYLLNRKNLAKNIKSVESSIGSIKCL